MRHDDPWRMMLPKEGATEAEAIESILQIMENPPDKYDKAIALIMDGVVSVEAAWNGLLEGGRPTTRDASELFQSVYRDGRRMGSPQPHGGVAGCLTMIRDSPITYRAPTHALTEEIQDDVRLPREVEEFKAMGPMRIREILGVFAEWQRRLDKEIRTGPIPAIVPA